MSEQIDKLAEKGLNKQIEYSYLVEKRQVLLMKRMGMLRSQEFKDEQQIISDSAQAKIKKAAEAEAAIAEAKKKAKEKEIEDQKFSDDWHKNIRQQDLEDLTKTENEKGELYKKNFESMLGNAEFFGSTMTDIMGKSGEDQSKAIGNALKQTLIKVVDAWVAAEIGKATAAAPLTFGATLAAIGPQLAAASFAKGAIGAIEFAKGGIVPGNSTSGDNVPARLNSRELVLNTEQQTELWNMIRSGNGGGGGGTVQVNLMLDRKILAREIVNINNLNAKGLI